MRTAQFTPTEFPDRPRPWCVSIPATYSQSGKRERKFFNTKREALDYAKDEKFRVEREGRDATTSLSVSQRDAAAAAFRLLEGHAPQKIVEIVEQWLSKHKLASRSVSVGEAFDRYIERGKKRRTTGGMVSFVPFSLKHARGLRLALTGLEKHRDTMVSELTTKMIEDALAEYSPSYHNAQLRIIRAVCEYAVEKKWAANNAAQDVEERTIKATSKQKKKGSILTIDEAKRLLAVTAKQEPQFVPYVALSLFAGIRPDLEDGELVHMTWDMVRLEDGDIDIPYDVSKTDERRVFKMEDTLKAWLKYYAAKGGECEGAIVPRTNLRKRLRDLRAAAGIEWEQDIARRTFATYHLTHFENLARCVESMGHQDSAMLWKHYKRSVPQAEAAKFWQITPKALRLS